MAQANPSSSADRLAAEPRAVSFAFLKGGTSKTTLAVNTARQLVERNGPGSTLFIDFDPNGHATRNYDWGHDGELYHNGTDLDGVLLGSEAACPPQELAVESKYGLDLLPSSNEHEKLERGLNGAMGGSTRLHVRVVEELLGEHYQYIVVDLPSNSGMMTNNGVFGTRNIILPMLPKAETIESFKRTRDRLIKPIEERGIEANILALVPNLLGARIDQRTNDRKLLESINTAESLKDYVPNFAWISEEEWEQIDNGEIKPPKPGIREAAAITNGMDQEGLPLYDYAPEHDANRHFDELAAIVERGGVQR